MNDELIAEAEKCLISISMESRKIPLPDSDLEVVLESAHALIRALVNKLKLADEIIKFSTDNGSFYPEAFDHIEGLLSKYNSDASLKEGDENE